MQRNFLEIFSRPKDTRWAKEVPEEGSKGSQTHLGAPGAQARPGGLCPPWPPPALPLCSTNTLKIQKP